MHVGSIEIFYWYSTLCKNQYNDPKISVCAVIEYERAREEQRTRNLNNRKKIFPYIILNI